MNSNNKTVVFSGGVGGARFLSGLIKVIPQKDITVISNIGDDSIFYGLYVCPDIDIVIYTLADRIDKNKGWGLKDDTFNFLNEMKNLSHDGWFNIGDKDLATHMHRTLRLNEGAKLSEVTKELLKRNKLEINLFPVSDDRIETRFKTSLGEMAFQEYMVKNSFDVDIEKIIFVGADIAKPTEGVIESILKTQRIILAPSNPFISIGTMLNVKGIREALIKTKAKITAISPIVKGEAIKGPAARLMKNFGYEVSPFGIAKFYEGLIDCLIIDNKDIEQKEKIESLGIECIPFETMMTDDIKKINLAKIALN